MTHNPFLDTSTVLLADIVTRDTWQVRKRINAAMVKKYAAIYGAGTSMEPIRLARVDSVLMLIDGAHRLAALRFLGETQTEVIVTPMKEHAAQWAAASANLEHGMPLKSAELREVFRAYIATKQHHAGRGRVKSFAEIAKDIPGKTRYSYRNWMMKDFPEVFRKFYQGSGGEGHSHGGLDYEPRDQQALDLQAIEVHLRQAAALARTLPPALRRTVAKRMEEAHGAVMR
ncbi:hypothetical protein SRS16CHR_03595 [Variovorax sp. SRS16]|uniref:ParB N-terminal domain-containing protein n=1 Tax=Variovorax sp. SRS16 TaxID=282217 RepID=UPI001318FC33|nr:ParB N-terminal domain-containing protein [Variovorax sp. SRS16]VTU25114.1 hypothetical protein SRS16CHR_03595 [Variovorax sp. SRS16]